MESKRRCGKSDRRDNRHQYGSHERVCRETADFPNIHVMLSTNATIIVDSAQFDVNRAPAYPLMAREMRAGETIAFDPSVCTLADEYTQSERYRCRTENAYRLSTIS